MARTPPVTATARGPAQGPWRGLQQARAAYGAALILLPGPVIWLATGQRPSRRARRVAQVLGARHLIQAGLTAAAPSPAALAAGGRVDAVHATSMLLLAAVSRAGRRAALTDALTEAALAAVGATAARYGVSLVMVEDRASVETFGGHSRPDTPRRKNPPR